MLKIVTWWWGDKYGPEYLVRLANGVQRHLKQDYQFICVTDKPETEMDFIPAYFDYCGIPQGVRHLTKMQGCLARLCMFSPEFQAGIGAEIGDRIVCMDLDLIVTGPLDEIFDRDEPFVILQGANSINPCPYNGSLFQLRAGYRPDVWTDFSLKAAKDVPHYSFPDDQSWFAHKLKRSAGWQAGPQSGVLAFKKPGWPKGDDLPKNARVVAFPGFRDPAQFQHLDWVQTHWK